METLNLREEIKFIVDENFDFEFDTIEVPQTRKEFIDTLHKEFSELFIKYRNYKGDIFEDLIPNKK